MYNKKIEKDVCEDKNLLIECKNGDCIVMTLNGLDGFYINMIHNKVVKDIEKKYDINGNLDIIKFFDYYKILTNKMNDKTNELNSLAKKIASMDTADIIVKGIDKRISSLHLERLELLVEFDIYDYLIKMNNQEVLKRNKNNLTKLNFYGGK